MGFPLGNFIKGDKMKTASKTQLTYVLYLVNFPEGFLGKTHLRLPSLCTVPKLVLNSSSSLKISSRPFSSIWDLFILFLPFLDRKSTRLNSSHVAISYAVFC